MSRERVVVDTNVFISAALKPEGTSRKAIEWVVAKFDIIQSQETYLELTTRLSKPKFDKYISQPDRLAFLNAVRNQSLFINVEHQTSVCADVDDNKFLELAQSGKARYLITGDNDLLILKHYYETAIINPTDLISIVSS